jgi:hypothetical protein
LVFIPTCEPVPGTGWSTDKCLALRGSPFLLNNIDPSS